MTPNTLTITNWTENPLNARDYEVKTFSVVPVRSLSKVQCTIHLQIHRQRKALASNDTILIKGGVEAMKEIRDALNLAIAEMEQ